MRLKGKKILAFVHEDFEDLELHYPVYRLMEEGAEVVLAGEKRQETYTGKHGVPAKSDVAFEDVNPEEFDALIVPGGWAPDKIRRFPHALNIVRNMDQKKKPLGIICHAGWVFISAGILNGRKATSVTAIKDDMVNAGVEWTDEPVVVDGNLVSSRRPPDLPTYMRTFIKVMEDQQ
ncbi:MAG TPA: protease [Eubacteriaceae bacterium]|nr:protease [Eubacteriaceae bacterium]